MANCLDSPVRGHTLVIAKKFFLKKVDPLTLALTCAQNSFVERTFVN